MSQLQQALDALAAADAAGNKEDAAVLADLVRQLQAKEKAAPKEPGTPINPLATGVGGIIAGNVAAPMINKGMAAMQAEPVGKVSVSGAPTTSGGPGTPGQKYMAKTGYGAGEGSTVREVVEEYKSQQKPIGSGKISKNIQRGSPMGIDPFMEKQAAEEMARKKAAEATAKAMPMGQKVMQAMPGPVQKAGQFLSGAASSGVAPWLGRGLAGGAAGVQGADAYNRLQKGDIVGGGLSALGAAGSAASLIPTPMTRIGGPALSITAEMLKGYIDKKKAEKQEKAQGGLVYMADGGPVNEAIVPQGMTPPPPPAQPMPFYGMGDDVRNVQGTVLPTDADYQGTNTAVQMFGGMPQGTTPVMPTQPAPRNFGTGVEMPTYDGSGSVMQVFGGMPQGTTPVMPVQPPPTNFGTGVEMPTYDGTGSVMQMFNQQPLPFQRAQTMMQQRNPQVIPQKRVINPPRRPVAPPRPQLMARPQMARQTVPMMPAPRPTTFPTRAIQPGGLNVLRRAEGGSTTPAWQREEGKNPEGGLNAKGRASYNRETGGNLKAPQPEGGSRKKSFCARMGGMKKKLTSSKTANDPDSRINKALRKWKC